MRRPFCILTGTRSGSGWVPQDLFEFKKMKGSLGMGGAVLERYNPGVCRQILGRPDIAVALSAFSVGSVSRGLVCQTF